MNCLYYNSEGEINVMALESYRLKSAVNTIEEYLSNYYVGYDLERVSPHLTHIEYTAKSLESFKSFLGIKYNKKYSVEKKKVIFKYSHTLTQRSFAGTIEYIILIAPNEDTNTIYWSVETDA